MELNYQSEAGGLMLEDVFEWQGDLLLNRAEESEAHHMSALRLVYT